MLTSMAKPLMWLSGTLAWTMALVGAWAAMQGLLMAMGVCVVIAGILIFLWAFFAIQHDKWVKYVEGKNGP